MDRFDDETLFAELRELRPKPRAEFTAELDERAAAGFPRRSTRAAKTPFARLMERWRAMTPRRRLIPALGFALAALVVATVVVAMSQSSSRVNVDLAENGPAEVTKVEGGGGAASAETSAHAKAPYIKEGAKVGEINAGAKVGEKCAPSTAGCSASGEFTGEFFGKSGTNAAEEDGAEIEESAAAAGETEIEAPVEEEASEHTHASTPAIAAAPVIVPPPPPTASAGHRDIERSAYVVLGTKPGEVAGAAKKVYEAVYEAHGVVLQSSVQSGKAGPTGASFELLIPSRKLDDTLAAFSQIAEVRSRHDATADITAPTVGAAEELADSNASIEGLLKELGNVETEAERESVEARLHEERRRHAAIRASLDHLHKRASTSEVSVRIVTDHGAGVTPGGSDSGNWGVGDALHDAGHILTIAAGLLLIGLAVLAPIALILLLGWLANRFRLRRLRERTLG